MDWPQARPTSGPLDAGTRTHFESRFGHDFGGVRVHTDAAAAASADELAADAYTAGNDVYFAAGRYSPELLAHELAHVVQQSPLAQRQASAEAIKTAEEAHVRQQRRVAGLIREPTIWSKASGQTPPPAPVVFEEHKPLDPARLMRNSGEWIRKGFAKLVVLTPVPGKADFYFDRTVEYPNTGGSVANEIEFKGFVRAETDTQAGRIFLPVRPATTDEQIRETLIHEVQHLADVSAEDRPAAMAKFQNADPKFRLGWASFWNLYQKEFRGYWIESQVAPTLDSSGQLTSYAGKWGSDGGPGGDYTSKGSYSSTSPACLEEVTVTFKNEKQKNIATHLLRNNDLLKGTFHCSDIFRANVVALDNPESRNFVNSVRIEMLRQTLADPRRRPLQWGRPAIVRAAHALDDVDRAALKDQQTAKPFWNDAKTKLAPEVYQWLYDFVMYRKDVPLPEAAAP